MYYKILLNKNDIERINTLLITKVFSEQNDGNSPVSAALYEDTRGRIQEQFIRQNHEADAALK